MMSLAVVPSHAWDVIERWLRASPDRYLCYDGGDWCAMYERRVAEAYAPTIPELAGKLRG